MADIYVGDCAKIMQENIKDGSVALTVTSPPYDNLRKYGGKSSWSFDVFSNIANQLYRVTMDGGVIVWITADAGVTSSISFSISSSFIAAPIRPLLVSSPLY